MAILSLVRLLRLAVVMAVCVAVVSAVFLGGLFLGTTSPTAAQETAFGSLRGTAYRLVDQIIVDGVIEEEIELPVTDGRIAIPELGIDQPLAADGSFHFSNLPVSADLDNPTEVTVIFTAPGLGSYTYEHLRLHPGTGGPILTPQMISTPRTSGHPRAPGPLPDTGGGGPLAGSGPPVASGLLALVGAALVCAGASMRLMRRLG